MNDTVFKELMTLKGDAGPKDFVFSNARTGVNIDSIKTGWRNAWAERQGGSICEEDWMSAAITKRRQAAALQRSRHLRAIVRLIRYRTSITNL